MSIQVLLSADDVGAADALALKRGAASRNLRSEKYKPKSLPQIAYDCCAAYGEFAVAKFLSQPPPDGVNTWHAPDVGDCVQVRTIGLQEPGTPPPSTKGLLVRPNDNGAHLFVLVHVDMQVTARTRICDLLGYIEGEAAQRPEWWHRDVWIVPRTALMPCDLLPDHLVSLGHTRAVKAVVCQTPIFWTEIKW
jgi:hypothetical protein